MATFNYSLPFADNYKVDTSMRVRQDGNTFKFELNNFSRIRSFSVELKQDDIKEINNSLIGTLQKIKELIEVEDHQLALFKLAQAGKFAFNTIFNSQIAKDIIFTALQNARVVQIISDGLSLPWELLYDGGSINEVEISHFWGMKYLFCHSIITDSNDFNWSPEIYSDRFRVGLITNTNLDGVKEIEIPCLEKFSEKEIINLQILPKLIKKDETQTEIEKFISFLINPRELYHFACHSKTDSDSPRNTRFIIDEDFSVTIESFKANDFMLADGPFIILNACRTGSISHLHSFDWASIFCQIGARGVISTLIEIPDSFAATFIIQFYEKILRGETVGKSLFQTRLDFWEKFKNPLGLAYTLYLSPEIKFKTIRRQ